MIKLRSAVIVIENMLIGLFALFLAINLLDLQQAWNATSCGVQAAPNCYPWAPRAEGPIEGAWNYTSKTTYLVSSVVTATVLGVTLLSTFVLTRGRRILGLLGGIATLYLSDLLLPRLM